MTEYIKNCLKEPHGSWYNVFHDYGVKKWGAAAVARMYDTFHYSRLLSIDVFLERWREEKTFREIGYQCIAFIINHEERKDKLFQDKHPVSLGPTWCQLLHNKLNSKYETLEEYLDAPVAFITFNYDRSLELHLVTALSNTFGVSADHPKIQSFIERRIIHVHGSLGDLDERPYQPVSLKEINDAALTQMASRLRIISDSDDPGLLQSVQDMVREATKIHILGLSYQPANIRKVAHHFRQDSRPSLTGTAFGLYPEVAVQAKDLLERKFGCTSRLSDPKIACAEYIERSFKA